MHHAAVAGLDCTMLLIHRLQQNPLQIVLYMREHLRRGEHIAVARLAGARCIGQWRELVLGRDLEHREALCVGTHQTRTS